MVCPAVMVETVKSTAAFPTTAHAVGFNATVLSRAPNSLPTEPVEHVIGACPTVQVTRITVALWVVADKNAGCSSAPTSQVLTHTCELPVIVEPPPIAACPATRL